MILSPALSPSLEQGPTNRRNSVVPCGADDRVRIKRSRSTWVGQHTGHGIGVSMGMESELVLKDA